MRFFSSALILAMAAIPFTASAEHLKSVDPKGIDPNTPASQDFYQHVNKDGWRVIPSPRNMHAMVSLTS